FGAKGVGESATLSLSPAIANALDDAVGIRLMDLPLTAEAIFRALREKEGRPTGSPGLAFFGRIRAWSVPDQAPDLVGADRLHRRLRHRRHRVCGAEPDPGM